MRVVLALALLPLTASAQTLSPAEEMAQARSSAEEVALCASAETEDALSSRQDVHRLQSLVDDLRAQLLLPQRVQVSVVPSNTHIMSVEAMAEEESFHLSLDESFLECMSDEELTAALAHELGHVWVFTHHPYLQTEALANEIAMRLVTRESLVRLYERMRQWQETRRVQ